MLRALLLLSAATLSITPARAAGAPCAAGFSVASRASTGADWTRWGGDVRHTRHRDATSGGLRAADVPRLTLKWAYSLGETVNARSQPAVSEGRVFVGSEAGVVSALDAGSGCTLWTFRAEGPVRSGIVASPATQGMPAAIFFGSAGGVVFAVDASTGRRLWKSDVEEHVAALVTGAPQLHRGVLYVPVSSFESVLPLQPDYACCTFRGSVVALEASSGKVLWKRYLIDEPAAPTGKSKGGAQTKGPSGVAVWSTPTVDERLGRLYVGTGNNYSEPSTSRSDAIVALDMKSGEIVWSRQFTANDAYNSSCDIPRKPNCPAADGPDHDFGQPPILVTLPGGRRALVAGQKSGDVRALDPDRNGASLWETRVDSGGKLGGMHWGSATDGRSLYVAVGGQQLGAVADSTSREGYRLVPDPKRGGGLFALDLATGRKIWSAPPPDCGDRTPCSPAQSAPVTVADGVLFSGSLDGHLRAYSTGDGKIVWDVDTAREYDAVNGIAARGGSLDVAGPVVAGGMVFVTSGYALYGGMRGNVVLAFSIDGQ